MERKFGIGVGITLCLVVLKLILRANAHSYDHQAFPTPYGGYGADPTGSVSRSYDAEALAAQSRLQALFEDTVARHCQSAADAYLEPQGSYEQLFRSFRRTLAPKDVSIPSPAHVLGISVVAVLTRGDEQQTCVDFDEALAERLAEDEGPAPSELQQLGPGSWLVSTDAQSSRRPASTALVSRKFLARLGAPGRKLVAFSPTDHRVAFADASSRAAILLAARKLQAQLGPDQGVGFLTPFIWDGKGWKEWTPDFKAPELSALAAKSLELTAADAAALIQSLRKIARPEIEDLLAHAPTLPREQAAERLENSKQGSTVVLDPESLEGQQLTVAARVRVTPTLTVSWERFQSAAGNQLRLAKVDEHEVPGVYILEAGFQWPTTKAVAHATP